MSVNLSAWTTMQFLLDWQRAAESGDFITLNRLMSLVITDWGYAGHPSDVGDYANLSPAEWSACVKEVSIAIGAMFR